MDYQTEIERVFRAREINRMLRKCFAYGGFYPIFDYWEEYE